MTKCYIGLDYEEFLDDLRTMTKPLYKNDQKKSFEATAFLCSYKGRAFIVSAGHVLSNADNKEFFVRMDNNTIITINNAMFIDSDKNDIMICEIKPEELEKIECCFFDLAKNFYNDIDNFESLIFCGYPTSKHNTYKKPQIASLVSCRAHTLHSPYPVALNGKIDKNYHIVGEFSSKNVTVVTGNDKKHQALPKLTGLSGGPVFGLLQGNPRPYFAGIGIKRLCNQKYLVAIRNSIVIKSIEEYISNHS